MRVIDFHTHAFPDPIADRAIPLLEAEGNIKARLDGKVSSLLQSMDRAGIEQSVVCSIATRPEQFDAILKWSKSIASDRLIPFPSVHPDDPRIADSVRTIHEEGFKGIKLHGYYQDFDMDEERAYRLYGEVEKHSLVLLCHTGFDMAHTHSRKADPVKVVEVVERFPQLKLVTSHLGAWQDWEEVRRHLLGKPIYMDVSYSLNYMSRQEAEEILLGHLPEYLLFGTDSPWADQTEAKEAIRALNLGAERELLTFSENALKLLNLS